MNMFTKIYNENKKKYNVEVYITKKFANVDYLHTDSIEFFGGGLNSKQKNYLGKKYGNPGVDIKVITPEEYSNTIDANCDNSTFKENILIVAVDKETGEKLKELT